MSGLIAEIASVVIAAFSSAAVMMSLQRQGRVKHRFRATIGLMLAVLAISLIVSRFILGRLDNASLLVDVPVIIVGAVLFRTGVHWGKSRTDN